MVLLCPLGSNFEPNGHIIMSVRFSLSRDGIIMSVRFSLLTDDIIMSVRFSLNRGTYYYVRSVQFEPRGHIIMSVR